MENNNKSLENSQNIFEYERKKKSKGAAFAFWFLGACWLGGHRFYAGRWGTGIVQFLMTFMGIGLLAGDDKYIGVFLLIANGIWLTVDLFLIPSMIRSKNMVIAKKYKIDISKINVTF